MDRKTYISIETPTPIETGHFYVEVDTCFMYLLGTLKMTFPYCTFCFNLICTIPHPTGPLLL